MFSRRIFFWQVIVSPHMAGLARALARRGCKVVYAAQVVMSPDRAKQGWALPDLGDARLEIAATESAVRALVARAPADSVHICQGMRGNGLVRFAQSELARRGLRQWVIMETVDDGGALGLLKRMEYRRLLWVRRKEIQGFLANGYRTADWLCARGASSDRVFPFAYFLPNAVLGGVPAGRRGADSAVRFVFVGQFIELKRLDWIIRSLVDTGRSDFELAVIGSGPLESELRVLAERSLPAGSLRWIGRLAMNEVTAAVADSDCLILPSRHDGWGAVVSEALMQGTPAICSDACGSAGVVMASGVGGVFARNDRSELTRLLIQQVNAGPVMPEARQALSAWARCLGAEAGAEYLLRILQRQSVDQAPVPPWVEAPSPKVDRAARAAYLNNSAEAQ